MNSFERLLKAKTEQEFFIVLSCVVRPQVGYRPENQGKNVISETHLLQAGNARDGYALEFEIVHSLSIPNHGSRTIRSEKTHVFTLRQDGTLTWWMLGQAELIVGLDNIQAKLSQWRGSMREHFLPSLVETSGS